MQLPMQTSTKVVLCDDHALVRQGLAGLVTNLGYIVLFECDNGSKFIEKIDKCNLPDIVLMDINMPEVDGFETTRWLKKNYPSVKVLAVSMYEDDKAIIRMLRNGARGYILKNADLTELKTAIQSIMTKGFHYSEMVTGKLIHSIQQMDDDETHQRELLSLSENEITFLKLASSEMTYKEIARKMHVSPRTVDRYRDILFEKLDIKTRVGLVLFAIKNGVVQLN